MNKVELLKTQDRRSYKIKTVNGKGEEIIIPVIDVRDGEQERNRVKRILKTSAPQSKFMPFTYGQAGGCYQLSHKKSL